MFLQYKTSFFAIHLNVFSADDPNVFSSVNDLDFSADDLNIFQPIIKMFLGQGSRKIIYRQNVQLCRRAGGLVIPPATGDSVSPGLYSILQGGIVKAKHSLCHRERYIALIKLFQHTGFIHIGIGTLPPYCSNIQALLNTDTKEAMIYGVGFTH